MVMSKQKVTLKKKVNKNEFLARIAHKKDIDMAEVKEIYEAIVDEIMDVVCSGQELSLTGFGTFALKKHKGHPVQFEAKAEVVDEYVVLKFAASDVLMTRIRSAYAQGVAQASS